MIKRAYEKGYLIDGTPLLSPDRGVEFSSSVLSSSCTGRDEAGYMHIDIIRDNIRKWSFSYSILTTEEYQYLIKLLPKGKTFNFSFTNENGQIDSTNCYCNQTSVAFYSNARGIYKNLKFDILEA